MLQMNSCDNVAETSCEVSLDQFDFFHFLI